MIMPTDYVPLLRWRMGEYQALERLDPELKAGVIPLIEVLPPDYDFELRKPKKNIGEQLTPFAKQLKKRWGDGPALLDAGQLPTDIRMDDGRHPLTFLFDETRAQGAELTPVTSLDRDNDYQHAVFLIGAVDGRGAALRCTLDEVLDPDFNDNVAALLARLEIEVEALDILLDLQCPAYDPQDGLVAVVTAALSSATIFSDARSVTILATSFPDSLSDLKQAIQFLPRREWVLYKALVASLPQNVRRPGFGDYAVAAVTFAQGDMRFMRGSPNIRYAVDDGWLVAKGKRDKGGGNQAYPGLCSYLTASGRFLGPSFSAGSAYIDGCRTGSEKRGNQTTWKWVATNHHITKVVNDLATLNAS